MLPAGSSGGKRLRPFAMMARARPKRLACCIGATDALEKDGRIVFGAGATGISRPRTIPWERSRLGAGSLRAGCSRAYLRVIAREPNRARLPGAQAGSRAWPLRGTWLAGLSPSRHSLYRGLRILGLRKGDDSPSGSCCSIRFEVPALPPGYRPRGAAAQAATSRPQLDCDPPSQSILYWFRATS